MAVDRQQTLRDRTRYEPAEVEPRVLERWLAAGLLPRRAGGDGGRELLDRDSAAEHHRRAPHGPRAERLDPGRAGPRCTACRACAPSGSSAPTTPASPPRPRSSGSSSARARRKELIGREEFERRVWEWREQYGAHDRHPVPAPGRLLRLRGRALHARRGLRARRHAGLQGALRQGPDLPRQLHGQLGSRARGRRSPTSRSRTARSPTRSTTSTIRSPTATASITVATVRPETMLADTAVAVNPDDERYADLVGREVVLPLVGRQLTVIADEYVKPEFGTGALKITPGHDPNDFEIGRRHGLEEISVIGEDGLMTEAAGRFAGLTVEEAREGGRRGAREGGADLQAEPYTHTVPFSHRSGERIEPLISLQWFMRDGRAGAAGDRGRHVGEGAVPSRALGQGLPRLAREHPALVHLAPALVGPPAAGLVLRRVRRDLRRAGGARALRRLRGPAAPGRGRARHLVLVGAVAVRDARLAGRHDRAARVLSDRRARDRARHHLPLGRPHGDDGARRSWSAEPFEDVYITPIIQAPDGRRMSKSLGTGIDPLDEIEAHGADAVRFGLLAMASSQDVRYSHEKVQQGQQLANKMWNASRLVLLNVAARRAGAAAGDRRGPLDPVAAAARDRARSPGWSSATTSPTRRRSSTRSSGASCATGTWRWSSRACTAKARQATTLSATLLYVLEETLALAHPFMPFVTEEIYSFVPGRRGRPGGARVPASPTTS